MKVGWKSNDINLRNCHICKTLFQYLAFLLIVEENLDKENNRFLDSETASPPLSLQLRELSMNLKSLFNTSNLPSPPEKYQTVLTKSYVEELPQHSEITELKTPERSMPSKIDCSPWKTFSAHSSKLKVWRASLNCSFYIFIYVIVYYFYISDSCLIDNNFYFIFWNVAEFCCWRVS